MNSSSAVTRIMSQVLKDTPHIAPIISSLLRQYFMGCVGLTIKTVFHGLCGWSSSGAYCPVEKWVKTRKSKQSMYHSSFNVPWSLATILCLYIPWDSTIWRITKHVFYILEIYMYKQQQNINFKITSLKRSPKLMISIFVPFWLHFHSLINYMAPRLWCSWFPDTTDVDADS